MAVNDEGRGPSTKQPRKAANTGTRGPEKKSPHTMMFTKSTWARLGKAAIDADTDRSMLAEKWIKERLDRFGARGRQMGESDDSADCLIEGGTIEETFTPSAEAPDPHSPGEGERQEGVSQAGSKRKRS